MMMIILKTKKDKKDFTKLTVVQVVGENNYDNLIEKYKDKCYKKNIDFEWYVYPKDITTKELKQEIIDLLPFIAFNEVIVVVLSGREQKKFSMYHFSPILK